MTDVEVPAYDPGVHTVEENPVVRLELWCSCGRGHRQVDPVSHCLPQIADFRAKHSGDGHGPASPQDAVAEREARREAGFRAVGRQAEYERKEHDVEGATAFDWTPPPADVAQPKES